MQTPLLHMKKETVIYPILVGVAALAAFARVLYYPLLNLDKNAPLFTQTAVTSGNFSDLWKTPLQNAYQPLAASLLALTKGAAGSGGSWHLVSMVLHVLGAVLLYVLLRRWQHSASVALWTALVWAVSPLKVEAVVSVGAQPLLLASVLGLGALWAWTQFRARGAAPWMVLGLVFFALAGLAHPAAGFLPLLAVFTDRYAAYGKESARPANWLPTGLLALVGLGVVTYGYWLKDPFTGIGWLERVLITCHSIGLYLYKTLIPVGLSFSYPVSVTGGQWPWMYYAAPLLLAVLLYGGYRLGQRDRVYSLAAAMFFVPLIGLLPLLPLDPSGALRADRFAYLASAGVLLALFHALHRYYAKAAPWIAGALFLGNMALTWQQTGIWRDEKALYSHCAETTPTNAECWCKLGDMAWTERNADQAMKHYNQALQSDPSSLNALLGRGRAYAAQRRFEQALADFDKAIATAPNNAKAYLERGKCMVMLGQLEQSVPDLERSYALQINNPEAYFYRGFVAERANDIMKALTAYSTALMYKPDYVEALVNRGVVSMNNGVFDQAIQDFTKALETQSNNSMIWNNRANAYMEKGRTDLAMADINKAIQLNPNYGRAYETRSRVYKALGDLEKSGADLAKANTLRRN